ncbi:MAG TPA: FAD/NAD(P)-binding oxidoreductase [Anaeromyxobacteraceae bacterium]|nr:FAD/NAD(P)-binding oxidoreductase [Anaeromyxobacteraceae bacterium]
MAESVLILGGGIGGVAAANALRKRLPRSHRIVVVDREPDFKLAASFLWVMTGARTPEQVSRPLDRLRRKGIEVQHGEVEGIAPQQREAVVNGKPLRGDHLIVALGAEFALDAIPGLAEAGHTFCTLDGATALRAALAGFRRGRVVVLTAAPAYKCPAAPYEAAMLIEADCRRRGIRNAVELSLYSAEPGPMGVAGPEVSAAVRGLVEQKGIAYHPEHQITRIEGREIVFANGARAGFDLLAYVPPIRPPRALLGSGLVDESGWVRVDRRTMKTRFPGVHAIGDATMIPLAMGKPLPRAGVFAHGQAEVVARNIARTAGGQGHEARFDGHGSCFIETGGGLAGFGAGDFYAEPLPAVSIRRPRRLWHAGKVLLEKRILWQWL